MIHNMKRFVIGCLCAAIMLAMGASQALAAASSDGAEAKVDARLQNYAQSPVIPGGGYSTSWMLLAALGVLCMIVLFKNAKRSHLD